MSFREFQEQATLTRANTETRRDQWQTNQRRLANVGRKKTALGRSVARENRDDDQELQKLAMLETRLGAGSVRERGAYAAAARYELQKLREYEQYTNPIFNAVQLDDDCPILLCPLRIETRFKKVSLDDEIRDELWVRVFPDDIAIDSFESDLSASELRNIRQYWIMRWAAGGAEDGNRGAWRSLVSSHGPGRGLWMVRNHEPENVTDEPDLADGEIILVIAAETAPPALERAALVDYWRAVWKAGQDASRAAAAKSTLESALGAARAESIVDEYKPANAGIEAPAGVARDDAGVQVTFVVFPTADELDEKLHPWSQPPSASILPERFVFLGYRNDELALSPVVGNLVPPKLVLGPEPAADEGEDFRVAEADDAEHDEGELVFSENLKWMFDFEEAVRVGMGFRIELTPELASEGFDRVFVIGIKLGADKQRGQELLQGLIEQHHISRKGFGILQQGTPTNNTEADDAGHSWRHDPDDSFDTHFAGTASPPDPRAWFEKTDGRWLAEMLGIDAGVLQNVDNYSGTDICESKAMQRALWPATLGHFMDSMMHPVFGKATTEQVREFFTYFVSGRGSLPVIRVGDQPYGILPATNYSSMQWLQDEERPHGAVDDVRIGGRNRGFLMDLYSVLLDVDRVWMSLSNRVSYVGKSGDPHQILLDVVGLHPDSAELYKRYANSLKQLHNIYSAATWEHGAFFDFYPTTLDAAKVLLARFGYNISDKNPEPEILRKSFFEKSWILKGSRIDKVPNTEDQPISAFTDGGENYITWLLEAARQSHDQLRKQEGFTGDRPPTALLYLLLYHALDLSYIDTSLKLHRSKELMSAAEVAQAYVEPDFIHIEAGNETESRWKHLYKTDPTITGSPDQLLTEYIPQHLETLDEAAAFRDALAGMQHLENVATGRLERLLMEHIDTVSYRYDAWVLGLVQLQLSVMRGLEPDTDDESPPPREGVYLGAYGWLEDLRPENKVLTPVTLSDELKAVFDPDDDLVRDSTNAGHILAPSQNHAVTAAVLRNGHLTNDEAENREQLNINLSSNRVRLALQIIEGVQGGQPLAALLGYRFERGLHDRTDAEVDEFIFDLRKEFPLSANKLDSTIPNDSEYESISDIEARNVIDGAALLEHIENSGNRNYPFGLPLPAASGAQATAIDDEILELIEVNDAVADLAMAESVHQVVSGNYERAAATLDTYSKGNFPPTPDVIKTPRSGVILTHRVGLHFQSGILHDINQPDVTPRKHAEPAADHWLSTILPGMDEIVCVVDYTNSGSGLETRAEVTMEQLGLAPLDILYLLNVESDQAMASLDDLVVHFTHAGFATRIDAPTSIAYTDKLTPEAFTVFEISSLVASLRALLLNSRPLNAADILLSNEANRDNEQTVSFDDARLSPLATRLGGLRTGPLTTYRTGLAALIAAGDAADIVNALDTLMRDLGDIFIRASHYGLPQTGVGFVYQWRSTTRTGLGARIDEVIARWEKAADAFTLLIDEYNGIKDIASDDDLFAILTKAELKISTVATRPPPPASPADFHDLLQTNRFTPFTDFLDNRIRSLHAVNSVTDLLGDIAIVAVDMAPFDVLGFDFTDALDQLSVFAQDLLNAADALDKAIDARTSACQALIAEAAASADPATGVELLRDAAKKLLGEDFVVFPEFSVAEEAGVEWQNALGDSGNTLRYLEGDLDIDFPVDDWLYGLARVREKLYHLENSTLHIEGFNDRTIDLVPAQFPYRADDYWLGLQYPEEDPDSGEPFAIGEDKLLYTAAYAAPFDGTRNQCGALLDEWTEMIPSRSETAGLAFHYDQPNSEPPQALLLVTPSQFTGNWRWDDLVDSLHATLDMARKRAVEPDHVDDSVYGRFLPPIVSLASPMPMTATLNLVLNNEVFFAKVTNDE